MENGLLNLASHLFSSDFLAAGSGECRAEQGTKGALQASVSILVANSGKSCRIPLK